VCKYASFMCVHVIVCDVFHSFIHTWYSSLICITQIIITQINMWYSSFKRIYMWYSAFICIAQTIITHINEDMNVSYHTYENVVMFTHMSETYSHTCRSYIYTHERGLSHISMCHITRVKTSFHTHGRVVLTHTHTHTHTGTSHTTHT